MNTIPQLYRFVLDGPEALMDVARTYIELGFKVGPVHSVFEGSCTCANPACAHAGKHPATPHGAHSFTNDPDRLAEMFAGGPHNLGVSPPKGVFALDIDPRNGGDDTVRALEKANGELPDTVEVATGGGGRHLLFSAPDTETFSGSLGAGVEIKRHGGLLVAPPSLHASGSHYRFCDGHALGDIPIAVAPEWLVDALTKTISRELPSNVASQRLAPNQEYAERAIEREILTVELAHEGVRNNTLFEAALHLGRFIPLGAISHSDLTARLKSAGLKVGLDAGEVAETVERGLAIGASPERQFTKIETAFSDDVAPLKRRVWGVEELRESQRPDWLISKHVHSKALSVVYGPPKNFKTFITLDQALCIATGVDWHGFPTKRAPVFYVSAEGSADFADRVKGWLEQHDLMLDDLDGWFYWMAERWLVADDDDLQAVLRELRQLPVTPAVAYLDTLARCFNGEENSASEMGRFIQGCDQIKREIDGAVFIVHHSGKAEERGLRGSSALGGAVDTSFEVKKSDGLVTFKCELAKSHKVPEPIHFEMAEIDLGTVDEDGDPITTLVPVKSEAKPRRYKTSQKERVLGAFQELGRATQKQLSEATGLKPNRVSEAMKQLLSEGLIREAGKDGRAQVYEAVPPSQREQNLMRMTPAQSAG